MATRKYNIVATFKGSETPVWIERQMATPGTLAAMVNLLMDDDFVSCVVTVAPGLPRESTQEERYQQALDAAVSGEGTINAAETLAPDEPDSPSLPEPWWEQR